MNEEMKLLLEAPKTFKSKVPVFYYDGDCWRRSPKERRYFNIGAILCDCSKCLILDSENLGFYIETIGEYLVCYYLKYDCSNLKWEEFGRMVIAIVDDTFFVLSSGKTEIGFKEDITGHYNTFKRINTYNHSLMEIEKFLKGMSVCSSCFDGKKEILSKEFLMDVVVYGSIKEAQCSVKCFNNICVGDISDVFYNRSKNLMRYDAKRDFCALAVPFQVFAYVDAKFHAVRIFEVSLDSSATDKESIVKNAFYREVFRIDLNNFDISCIPDKFLKTCILFYDTTNLDDSCLKYFKDIFVNYNNKVKKCIKHNKSSYFLNVKNLLFLVKEQFYEKVYKSNFYFLKQIVVEAVTCYRLNFSNDYIDMFLNGIDFNKKNLNQMLLVPSYFLERLNYLDIKHPDSRIAETVFLNAKKLFHGNDDYFIRMNNNDIDYLIDSLRYFIGRDAHYLLFIEQLISIFGARNWKNYFSFFQNSEKMFDLSLSEYQEYLEKLTAIGDLAKDAQWKVTGTALKKASESINPAYFFVCDKTIYAKQTEAFKNQEETWKNYCFDDDRYIIKYPMSPSELIKEGLALNHCVKTFLNAVAEGETMILFIRQKGREDKPFFTLEIRDKVIRQCHGNSNCNMDSSLRSFIKQFCDKKQVEYYEGDSVLGV